MLIGHVFSLRVNIYFFLFLRCITLVNELVMIDLFFDLLSPKIVITCYE